MKREGTWPLSTVQDRRREITRWQPLQLTRNLNWSCSKSKGERTQQRSKNPVFNLKILRGRQVEIVEIAVQITFLNIYTHSPHNILLPTRSCVL